MSVMSVSTFDDELGPMVTRTAFALASMAECASPNTSETPGANFLRHVETDALEYWAELAEDDRPAPDDIGDLNYDGRVHEMADSAVPIYTHALWSTFVDLAAYQEDVAGDYGPITDLEQGARVALYMIAERLAWAILSELAEDAEDETAA